jgi:ABC-type thiamine transport system ATPase subunit
MRHLNIEHLWRRRLDHLHPGGQRLVATVRTLFPRRPLTLLDEPFAALDPVARERLADLLRDAGNTGRTVVITSNCPTALARAGSEGWALAAGRLTPVPCEAAAFRDAVAAGGRG